ncbi:MAG: PAS domain-containing sensor histidine kinase [Solirubrobacteraceae bacterium]|nr:PAS domain-containing sensor histidine kinase [Solirubrobacteraceae bacterium]
MTLDTGSPELLPALLASVGDGVYVVSPDGTVAFVNPAGLAILGYDDGAELLGRASHSTIHAHHRDGSPYPEEECPLLRPRVTGEAVQVDDDWFVRRDGSMVAVAYSSAPFETSDGRAAVVVFRDMTSRLRAEEERLQAEAERAQATELAASRRRLVEAADAERRRLGRDLHDGAQQRLVNVVIDLQMALAESDLAEEGRPLVAAALDEARAAIEDLRELATGLHPSILANRGLRGAIVALTARAPLPVTFAVSDIRLPASVEAACYYVVAEALTNIAKHAAASEAHVTVAVDGRHVVVDLTDDGRGGARAVPGRGLGGLHDRVAAFGGSLEVLSPPGRGTTVRATIPLDEARSGRA